MNKTNKELINIINQTMENTEYILENHSYDHVYRVLKKWLYFFTLFSLFFFLLPSVAPHLGWYDTYAEVYFPFFRISLIFLSFLSCFMYYKEMRKPFLDVRQKDFLLLFLIFIIMLSTCQILGPLTYYFNQNMLLHLVNTIPLGMLITPLGIILLIYFTKNFKLIFPTLLSFVFITLCFTWDSIFHVYFEGHLSVGIIHTLITNFIDSGLPISLCFMYTLILLKKKTKN